jgi:aryl-alcohol dehydrogenase-like predicted oxidoreductase
MEKRKLGRQGLEVAAIGLGCMSMTGAYGVADEAEAIATIHEAVDRGVDLFDTAEFYGPFTNERLVGRALRDRRERVTIATKFGMDISPEGNVRGLNSRPEHVVEVADRSLERLGVETIDLFYQHRVDPNVPIEETVGAMADLVRAGKVRWLGLSEASPRTLRRAHAVHPISALQSEYSLWQREVEHEILPTCRELGIGFVAYSPLGRGFLTGEVRRAEDYDDSDNRRFFPRFAGENFDRNLALAAAVREMADTKECTPAQIALSWLLGRASDVVPIPGTKRRSYLRDNLGAADVVLGDDDRAWLETRFVPGAAAGERYNPLIMATLDRS